MPKPLTLKLCLIEQAVLVQLDFLLHAVKSLRPQGNECPMPEEVLVETRRVFADLRRVVAGYPIHIADPVGPLTRGTLRPQLIDALRELMVFKELKQREQGAKRRNALMDRLREKIDMNLSPRVSPDIE